MHAGVSCRCLNVSHTLLGHPQKGSQPLQKIPRTSFYAIIPFQLERQRLVRPWSLWIKQADQQRQARSSPVCLGATDDERTSSDVEGDTPPKGKEVAVVIERLERNTRRIEASVSVSVPTEVVWGVLTDYGSLGDVVPNLAVNEVLETRPQGAKLLQIGEQDVAFGAKFSARIVMDVEEMPADSLDPGVREIEFRQLEGDFQKFEGVWRMEQVEVEYDPRSSGESVNGKVEGTKLTYIVEVSPQRWMPVRLIEGRIVKEIGNNLRSIQEEAVKRCCQPSSSTVDGSRQLAENL